ncbi:hypothetical protein FQZ97_840210 [compost metagenome]
MVNGVGHQVAQQLAGQPGVGAQVHRHRLQRKVQPLARQQRRELQADLACHGLQVHVLPMGVAHQLVHLGLRQQLPDQLAGAVHRGQHLGQRLAHLQLPRERALQLRAQHRKGRAQLVRSVGQETALLIDRVALLPQQPVHHLGDGLQFARRGVVVHRRGLALQAVAELAYGRQGAPREPGEHQQRQPHADDRAEQRSPGPVAPHEPMQAFDHRQHQRQPTDQKTPDRARRGDAKAAPAAQTGRLHGGFAGCGGCLGGGHGSGLRRWQRHRWWLRRRGNSPDPAA